MYIQAIHSAKNEKEAMRLTQEIEQEHQARLSALKRELAALEQKLANEETKLKRAWIERSAANPHGFDRPNADSKFTELTDRIKRLQATIANFSSQ